MTDPTPDGTRWRCPIPDCPLAGTWQTDPRPDQAAHQHYMREHYQPPETPERT